MVRRIRAACVAVVMALAAVALPGMAAARVAQPVTLESFAGVWEGSAQTPNGDVTLKATFNVADGKLGGTIESSMGGIPVVSAALADEKLIVTIDFQGSSGTLTCKLQGNRIDGTWEVGGNNGNFSLTRAGAPPAASGAEAITGAWSGEVQIAGQVMPFSMALRSNGDSLAGEVTSAAGSVPFGSVSWKDGTLQLAFPYVSGEPVAMTAQLKDGKLAGVVDYNKGEAAGTWTAVRKQ